MKKNLALHAISIFACLAFGILACAAETSLIPQFLDDAYLVPDLLLCMTVALGVTGGLSNHAAYGAVYGSLFGIYAGVLADSTLGFGIFLLPLFYMLCGYFSYVAADLIPGKKFPVYLATGLICCIGRAVVGMIYVMLSSGSMPILDVIRYVCIPLFFGTCIALPLSYPIGLLMMLPVLKIKHETIDKIL